MKLNLLPLLLFVFILSSFTKPVSNSAHTTIESNIIEDHAVADLYEVFKLKNTSMPQPESFTYAIKGYNKLKAQGKIKKEVLTIIDFSLSSSKKRLWVLDMVTQKVLFNSVVAHGRNTGGEYAKYFSNVENSNKSSLGFYITDNTYYGKNGLSLFLDGQERGVNSNARKRYVVFHGAKYANPDFMKRNNGVLGRSLGCPAVPKALNAPIINKIRGKSCMFIYHPTYKSKLIS